VSVTDPPSRREAILLAAAFAAERFLRGGHWEESAREVLARLGAATGATRVYLYRAQPDDPSGAALVLRWHAADAPEVDAGAVLSLRGAGAALQPFTAPLAHGQPLHGNTADQEPGVRAVLAAFDVLSFAVVPVFAGALWGVLGVSDCASERAWAEGELEGLRTAADLLGAALLREQAERALRESEERFRVLAHNVPGVVYLCRNDERYSMHFLSPAVEELTGLAAEEFLADRVSFTELYHPEDAPGIAPQVDAAVAERRGFHLVYRLRHADGGWRWIEERGQGIYDERGQLVYLEGSLVDVTERKQFEERLLHHALHDPLTELPNRTLLLDRLHVATQRRRRDDDASFAVLFVDIDRFKLVNDSLGHGLGDQLLVAIAHRLRACLRPGDTIARLGGDEFALVLERLAEPADALRVAERIQGALAAPFLLDGQEVYSSASIGIAFAPAAHATPEELLRDADTAMYQAKARGRGGHVVFDPEMHAHAVARLKLESELRRAVERGELRLLYQPIVALDGGAVAGVEALLRWEHPERGLLTPESFLDVAAETGVLPAVGAWVLHEACGRLRQWQRVQPDLNLHVNLHPVEFTHAELPATVAAALAAAGVRPDCLHLELTEHLMMADPERAAALLQRVRDLGVGLCLDDFGTGYSSLSALHRLPLTSLKVDRSFVTRLGLDRDGTEIVRTIGALSRSMALASIAEGVEREQQRLLLAELGYRYAQGFHFAPPLPPEAFAGWLPRLDAASPLPSA
jgi:diguanylate cyclase (GGDEF)-like protein/PAS domain S-box-containing protein